MKMLFRRDSDIAALEDAERQRIWQTLTDDEKYKNLTDADVTAYVYYICGMPDAYTSSNFGGLFERRGKRQDGTPAVIQDVQLEDDYMDYLRLILPVLISIAVLFMSLFLLS
ncbi:hypothetical protein FaHV1S18_112 [Falconid herpesvirus 1]|uniref:Uncharacterized protein n=2 Tax=Columbid alphaherpesvirus 1 TaxID=93386 RepID=A0A068ER97_9ALPH|nr:hypothetical protein FaHV1S18_112 [Falconid herpesvirus 1]YP_009353006.1 hypothetical protein CoHVHLJ_112 [Columbid alphaherpesvirus 1]AID52802.1 hypothetical protein FaHV1S18_112 [Falconid herpesvirus 1]ARD71423.1 hypothetical protein CoHVHLJ_112 [Columbid alphaherpesvirus 1]